MHHGSLSSRRPIRWAGLGIAAAVLAGLTACSPADPSAAVDRTLTIAVASIATASWDPAQGGAVYDGPLNEAVYEGLGYWDFETSSLVPLLAESFEVADDRRSMTVTLRENVDFVDGTHLDAAGAVDYYEYLLGSDGYVLRGAVGRYEPSFEVTGEYTFEISTSRPIFFPVSFAFLLQTPVLSPSAIDDPELVAAEPVGTGPYLIDEVVSDVEMTLIRNPDYRDPESYPYDVIVFKVFADPVAKLNALKTGQVDVTELTIPLGVEAESAGFTAHQFNGDYVTLTVQDPGNSPIEALRDVRVRQAIMHAFDREAIVESLYLGYGRPAIQAYVPGQPEYIEGGDDRYPYDPERARDLMAEAGYADGFDVSFASLVGVTTELEPIVQQSLGDIGIRATFEPVADGFELFVANIDGSHPLGFVANSSFANSTRLLDEEFVGLGRFFVPTPEASELLGTIRGADADASAAAAQDLGEFLLDELWYLPVVSPSKIVATIPEVDIDADPILIHLRDYVPAD